MTPNIPPDTATTQLVVETIHNIRVVRDDQHPGGTKARVLPDVLNDINANHTVVYATPAYGYAQIALAHAARATGRHAVIFVAQRSTLHPRTAEAAAAGAEIHQIPHGYLTVVQAAAARYCQETGATLIPFGVDTPTLHTRLTALARTIGPEPREVWTVAGSGTLTRALQSAWPDADFHAIQIGRTPNVGRARLHRAPEPFDRNAQIPPPFPSCSNYDAKAWRFVYTLASPGALFWNVAA